MLCAFPDALRLVGNRRRICLPSCTAKCQFCSRPLGTSFHPAASRRGLSALVCNRQSHTPFQGKWARMSAFYPRPLCNLMINALYPHVVNQHVYAMPCEPKATQPHRAKLVIVFGNPCMPIDVVMYEVGCKGGTTHALVHRLLDRQEWKGRPEVHAAIDSERMAYWKVGRGLIRR